MLVVVGIVLLLASTIRLMVVPAKSAADKSAALSGLRQCALAIQLYRENGWQVTEYGDLYSMGLPPSPLIKSVPELRAFLGTSNLPSEVVRHPMGFPFYYYAVRPEVDGLDPTWATYSATRQGAAVLLADFNFNDPTVPMMAEHVTKFGMGVRLDGSLVQRRAQGAYYRRDWWDDKD